MTPARAIPILLLLAVLAACSKDPDIHGSWKNRDGNLLILNEGGTARLGQEGLSGFAEARYNIRGDTVRVETVPQKDTEGTSSEEYVLVLRADTLHLEWIIRKRPGDYRTVNVDQMSRTIGKPRWKFAFFRISGESVL